MAKIDLEAVRKRARADLTLTTDRGEPDVFLLEHSSRIAHSARLIAALPEVAASVPDEAAAYIAGLYHAAGWAVRCANGEVTRFGVLLSPVTEASAELAAGMAEKSLSGVVPADTLERAVRAIRERLDRDAEQIEAQIVAEAENLEEFGLVPLWAAIRRGMLEGRGVQSVLESWQRKREYQFWTARLSDSFRFGSVQSLARTRLESMERFMADLEEQCTEQDVARTVQAGGERGSELRAR